MIIYEIQTSDGAESQGQRRLDRDRLDTVPEHKVSTMTTPWPVDTVYLQMDDLVVDLRFRRVIDSGRNIELPQRIFDLLILFLAEPHKLHTRNELFNRLWVGTIVEDTNLSQNVSLLRKALGEKRKLWIRTVAKGGYVFEPPGSLSWFNQPPTLGNCLNETTVQSEAMNRLPANGETIDDSQSGACVDLSEIAMAATQQAEDASLTPSHAELGAKRLAIKSLPQHHKRRALAIAAVMLISCLAAAFAMRSWRLAAGDSTRTVAVVVIKGVGGSPQWAATLLEQWLSWKLDSLPEVNLLTEADLAALAGTRSVDIVFVSSSSLPSDANKIVVYARLLKNGKEERFEAQGDQAEVAKLVDSLSRKIVARLMPHYEKPWPTLEVSANAAKRYQLAADAYRRRDFMAAAEIGKNVVDLAPRFGLMRLQLASTQINLYNATAAKEQIEIASKLLAPVPSVVAEQLQAQRLASDQLTEDDALTAYSTMAENHPEKTAYQLEHARLLLAAGRPGQALTELERIPTGFESASTKIAREQWRADAYRLLGEPERVRSVAAASEKFIGTLGPDWTLSRADALLSLAIADDMQYPERGVPARYEQAAILYEQAGNSTKALYARFRAKMGELSGDEFDPTMKALLARARAGGYRRLEVIALVAAAKRPTGENLASSSRSRYEQAYAIAHESGDVNSARQISVLLFEEDVLSARFEDAKFRAKSLRRDDLKTGMRYSYAESAALLSATLGDYARAIEALDDAEKLQISSTAQESSGRLAALQCVRGNILISMGRLLDSRKSFGRCSQVSYRNTSSIALLGQSRAEWLAGDHSRATTLLETAEARGLKEWMHRIQAADLAIRLGRIKRAEQIHAQLLLELHTSGYDTLIAMVRIGQAESAAASKNWQASRTHIAEAHKLVPDDAWSLVNRLDLVEAFIEREQGNLPHAIAIATKLHRRARQLGDVEMELQVHRMFKVGSIAGDCQLAARNALLAHTGMWGADINWLERPVTQDMLAN